MSCVRVSGLEALVAERVVLGRGREARAGLETGSRLPSGWGLYGGSTATEPHGGCVRASGCQWSVSSAFAPAVRRGASTRHLRPMSPSTGVLNEWLTRRRPLLRSRTLF